MPIDPLGPDPSRRQPFTPAEWVSDDPDRVVVRVATEAPGLLVVADTWMPGWTAEVERTARAHPERQPGPAGHSIARTRPA